VLALVLAAATLVPDNLFYLMLIGGVPLKYVALFYVIIDLSFVAVGENIGGHIAHMGGAAVGYLFIRQLKTGNDFSQIFNQVVNFFRRPFEKKTTKKGTIIPMRTIAGADKPKSASTVAPLSPQERVDQILDKINARGVQSLTDEEKTFLDNFSRKK
jgi:hypothetical protein